MKSWFTQILLLAAAVLFLLKGGMTLFVSLWRLVLPLALVGGGIYFLRKYVKQNQLKHSPADRRGRVSKGDSDVIEICPHCHQEIGSCPKCR